MSSNDLFNIHKFESVFTSAAVVDCVNDNSDYLLLVIPEIKNMIGFEHKHPHHHLDVWQHTLETMRNLHTTDLELNLAGLFHDIGKPFCYQEGIVRHFHGHPETSAKIAEQILTRLGYDKLFINRIMYLVTTHDTLINTSSLDNTPEMIKKRLQLQYADAKSHHPDKVSPRLRKLDAIAYKLNIQIE